MTLTRTVACENGCGQLAYSPAGEPAICPACVNELAAERARPQGETVRLFEPAPAQLAGQQDLALDAPTIHSSWQRPWAR